jgi:hypothetical protein
VSWWLHPVGPRRAAGARRCERAPRTRVPSSVDAVSSSRRVRGCALIDRRARPCRGRGATLGLEVLRSTRRPGDRARVRRRPCAPEPGDGAGVSEDPRTAAIAIRLLSMRRRPGSSGIRVPLRCGHDASQIHLDYKRRHRRSHSARRVHALRSIRASRQWAAKILDYRLPDSPR